MSPLQVSEAGAGLLAYPGGGALLSLARALYQDAEVRYPLLSFIIFFESHPPHKTVNLISQLVIVNTKLTFLWGS